MFIYTMLDDESRKSVAKRSQIPRREFGEFAAGLLLFRRVM
jgi:hypothetical protein